MSTINIKPLQVIASELLPGAVVSVTTESLAVYQADRRLGHEGENVMAKLTPCTTCNQSGEVSDAEGLPDRCPECNGRCAVRAADPRIDVDFVHVDIGHRTISSFCVLDTTDAKPHQKARWDLRAPQPPERMAQLVRDCLAAAAWESSHHDEVPLERKHALLDAVERTGSIHPDHVDERRARLARKE